MIATSKASDATSSVSAKRAAERSRSAAVRRAPRARPQHTRFPQRRSPAPDQRILDQQAGGTADPRGACGGRLMNAAHKFRMPTVSLDLTTSALLAPRAGAPDQHRSWADTLVAVRAGRQLDSAAIPRDPDLLGVTVIFGSFGLFAARNASVVAALFVCALSVSDAIYLILELDQPFHGFIQVSSTPLRAALARLGQ